MPSRPPAFLTHPPRYPIDRRLRRWLLVPGSLTAHLHLSSAQDVRVQRLRQGSAPAIVGEATSLRCGAQPPCTSMLHAREVVLHVGTRPMVYARSVAQQRHLAGPWRALRALGTRPLAELLYHSPWTRRSPLHIMRIGPVGPWRRHLRGQRHALGAGWQDERVSWARYSIFSKAGHALRVMEVFRADIVTLEPPRRPLRAHTMVAVRHDASRT